MSTCPSGRLGSVSVPFDEGDVVQLLASRRLFGGRQEIVEDVFGDHVPVRPHAPAQERQHVADAGADVRHRHARLQAHRRGSVRRGFSVCVAAGIAPGPAAMALRPCFGLVAWSWPARPPARSSRRPAPEMAASARVVFIMRSPWAAPAAPPSGNRAATFPPPPREWIAPRSARR